LAGTLAAHPRFSPIFSYHFSSQIFSCVSLGILPLSPHGFSSGKSILPVHREEKEKRERKKLDIHFCGSKKGKRILLSRRTLENYS